MSAATKSVIELDYHLQLFVSYLSNHNNEILLGVQLILKGWRCSSTICCREHETR